MTVLMRDPAIDVACPECEGSYPVSIAIIAESQRLIAEGCPVSTIHAIHECAPRYLAALLSPEIVALLTRMRADGASAPRPERRVDEIGVEAAELRLALDRWETEGGAVRGA